MRYLHLTCALFAAALAMGGTAIAAAPPATGPATSAAAPAGAAAVAPATSAAPATAAPASPLLAQDGAPAMAIDPALGHPNARLFGLQDQVTPTGKQAHWFHNTVLLPLITLISLIVLALLAWVVVRYRRAAHPAPSRTSHNTVIEVLWTVVPVLILVMIAVPSIRLLAAQYKPAPDGAVTLKAIGNQWFWSYEYPDNGGIQITANMLKERDQVAAGDRFRTDADGPRLLATDNRVVLPVGVPIRLITTANDVIHSWAMPAFWIKLDAIPGRLNETSFTFDKPGVYFGQCSELCGARHAFMPIVVEAVPPPVFAAWVRAKGGTMPAPAGAKGAGEAPGAAKPSAAAIPQPGSDAKDEATTAGNAAGPLENATVAAPTSTQPATANPAGPGNAEH